MVVVVRLGLFFGRSVTSRRSGCRWMLDGPVSTLLDIAWLALMSERGSTTVYIRSVGGE